MSKVALYFLGALALSLFACDEEAMFTDHAVSDIDAVEANGEPLAAVEAHPSEPRASCAVLYEHINFGGDRRGAEDGDRVSWIGGPWNDHVSSIQVRSGCVLNAYEHKDYGGAHQSFSGEVPRVGDWWNDRISSYTCSC